MIENDFGAFSKNDALMNTKKLEMDLSIFFVIFCACKTYLWKHDEHSAARQ
jgi:hypothetical protein